MIGGARIGSEAGFSMRLPMGRGTRGNQLADDDSPSPARRQTIAGDGARGMAREGRSAISPPLASYLPGQKSPLAWPHALPDNGRVSRPSLFDNLETAQRRQRDWRAELGSPCAKLRWQRRRPDGGWIWNCRANRSLGLAPRGEFCTQKVGPLCFRAKPGRRIRASQGAARHKCLPATAAKS
jgi:hypothetical protein